jgi:hypothetical protein
MPQIDLSTLDGAELRNLLDSARRHGQAAQSYEILREMEARRHRPPRPKTLAPKRHRREPHTISLELGDPLERREDPLLDEGFDDQRPLRLSEAPARKAAPPSKPPPTPKAAKPRGWAHWGALLFALGLAGGVYGGWWAANFANEGAPRAASPPPAPAAAAVQVATLPPAPPADSAEAPVSLVPEAAQAAPPRPPNLRSRRRLRRRPSRRPP